MQGITTSSRTWEWGRNTSPAVSSFIWVLPKFWKYHIFVLLYCWWYDIKISLPLSLLCHHHFINFSSLRNEERCTLIKEQVLVGKAPHHISTSMIHISISDFLQTPENQQQHLYEWGKYYFFKGYFNNIP